MVAKFSVNMQKKYVLTKYETSVFGKVISYRRYSDNWVPCGLGFLNHISSVPFLFKSASVSHLKLLWLTTMSQLIILMKNKAKSCHMSIHCSVLHWVTGWYFPASSSYLYFQGVFLLLSVLLSPLDPEHSCCLSMSHWLGNAVLNSLPQRSSWPVPWICSNLSFLKYIIFNPFLLFLHSLKLLSFMVL